MKTPTKIKADETPGNNGLDDQGYSKDPNIKDPKMSEDPAPLPQPEAKPAEEKSTETSPKVDTDTENSLANPLKYIVSPDNAIAKVSSLLELIKEGRPDLQQQVDQMLEQISVIENQAWGQEAPTQAGDVGDTQGAEISFNPGDKVSVETEEGTFAGVITDMNEDGSFEVEIPEQSMALSNVPASSLSPQDETDASAGLALPAAKKRPVSILVAGLDAFQELLSTFVSGQSVTEMLQDKTPEEIQGLVESWKQRLTEVGDALEAPEFLQNAIHEAEALLPQEGTMGKPAAPVTAKAKSHIPETQGGPVTAPNSAAPIGTETEPHGYRGDGAGPDDTGAEVVTEPAHHDARPASPKAEANAGAVAPQGDHARPAKENKEGEAAGPEVKPQGDRSEGPKPKKDEAEGKEVAASLGDDFEEESWDTAEVSRWVNNDEGLYREARRCRNADRIEEIIKPLLEGNPDIQVDWEEVNWLNVFNDVHDEEGLEGRRKAAGKVFHARKQLRAARLAIKAGTLKADFMQPEVFEDDGWEITHDDGSTTWMPSDVMPMDMTPEEAKEDAAQYIDVGEVEEVEKVHGWFGRYQAPGYLDSTPWCFGKTEEEVRKDLERNYGSDDDEPEGDLEASRRLPKLSAAAIKATLNKIKADPGALPPVVQKAGEAGTHFQRAKDIADKAAGAAEGGRPGVADLLNHAEERAQAGIATAEEAKAAVAAAAKGKGAGGTEKRGKEFVNVGKTGHKQGTFKDKKAAHAQVAVIKMKEKGEPTRSAQGTQGATVVHAGAGLLSGGIVDYEETSKAFTIKVSPEYKEELKAMVVDKNGGNTQSILTDIMEGIMANDDLDWIRPEEIGALTDSPIFGHVNRGDQGEIESLGDVFWYPNYAVSDPVEELAEKGEVVFLGSEANNGEYEPATKKEGELEASLHASAFDKVKELELGNGWIIRRKGEKKPAEKPKVEDVKKDDTDAMKAARTLFAHRNLKGATSVLVAMLLGDEKASTVFTAASRFPESMSVTLIRAGKKLKATKEGHNGWKNYETWLVNLWMTNDQGTYDMLNEITQSAGANHEKEDRLKEIVEDMTYEGIPDNGLVRDLVNAALGQVDWREIIENHAEDFGPAEKPEEPVEASLKADPNPFAKKEEGEAAPKPKDGKSEGAEPKTEKKPDGDKGEKKPDGDKKDGPEIEVVNPEGKVVDTLPDAFGDDTVSIIKLFQTLYKDEINKKEGPKDDKKPKEGDDKPKEKSEPNLADKPKALPPAAVNPSKDEEKELEAVMKANEAYLHSLRGMVRELTEKNRIVADQKDIDDILRTQPKGKESLEAALDAALKMAQDRKFKELCAAPDAEVMLIKASLPHLTIQASQIKLEASLEGLDVVDSLTVRAQKIADAGNYSLGSAFAGGGRYRGR